MSLALSADRPRTTTLASFAALALGLLLAVALFWPECQAAVGVWLASTAYGHCFLVAPIAAYLIWDRRESLEGLRPNPTPALALLALPLPFAWLIAERLGIMEGRQLVVIAFAEVLFLTTLGWRLYKTLMGPLLYLVFLVPFGAFLTPVLQVFTAHFIDAGLGVLGIPHYVNDMVIEISSGSFYVAEACAGLRFLIASIAFGVFFALLNYRSPGRRAAFMVASIAIPIVANGFRALGIVVLGNILGSAEAAAADHIIYGWVFFSFVMLLLVAAGLPFRENPAPAVLQPALMRPAPHAQTQYRAAALLLLFAVTGPAIAAALDTRATPARLAGTPTLAAPANCQLAPGSAPDTPDRTTLSMACPNATWTITLQALPARSTAAALNTAKSRLIGPIDLDEATVSRLPGPIAWQSIASHEPPELTATAAWIDGLPATGGLAQRVLQARHSILGGTHLPLVMAITTRPTHPVSENEMRLLATELQAFTTAQPDLTTQIAHLTESPR